MGYVAHISPDEVGELTPADLLDCAELFDALLDRGGDESGA